VSQKGKSFGTVQQNEQAQCPSYCPTECIEELTKDLSLLLNKDADNKTNTQ